MKNHTKFWIVLSLIIVFCAGLTGGILLNRNILGKKTEKVPDRRESARFPTLEIMAEELNLSKQQKERIREIFKNNEERLKILRSQIHEQFSAIRSELKEEIDSVLAEEQQVKFEAMIDKYLSQRKKQMEERKKHSEKYHRNSG